MGRDNIGGNVGVRIGAFGRESSGLGGSMECLGRVKACAGYMARLLDGILEPSGYTAFLLDLFRQEIQVCNNLLP